MVSERNRPELNSAALHRYLAEAVWCPPALLPSRRIAWTPIDESRALATLSDKEVKVELEFTFSPSGDVLSIYSPGRWMRFKKKGYKKVPWSGHFSDHFYAEGFRLPKRAKVSWEIDGEWEDVWKGEIWEAEFTQ